MNEWNRIECVLYSVISETEETSTQDKYEEILEPNMKSLYTIKI
jgi:hypothetical protein